MSTENRSPAQIACGALLDFAADVDEMARLTNYARSEFLTSGQTEANAALMAAHASYRLISDKLRAKAAAL